MHADDVDRPGLDGPGSDGPGSDGPGVDGPGVGRPGAGTLAAPPPAGAGRPCRRDRAAALRRADGDRRAQLARRLARLLLPAAEDAGGFTSTQLRIRAGRTSPDRAPDVVLVLGDPPADGLLRSAPALACFVDTGSSGRPVDARWWLRRGALAVWHLEGAAVQVWTAQHATTVRPPDALSLPLPSSPTPLRLAVADLLSGR